MQEFDESDTGLIHAYKLINILKYQLPEVFDDQSLIGLQFELECLNHEHLVDYAEFIKIFLSAGSQGKKLNATSELKLGIKNSAFSLNEYEDLLGKINRHVKNENLQLMNIFDVFCRDSGFISYEDLRKIIELIDYPMDSKQFDLLTMYADESG
jgi:Ca2+-binding EF-hand superfamily protein